VRRRVGVFGDSSRIGLNGKWLSQPMTGTQRYAYEITRRLVAAQPERYTLHLPKDATVPSWMPSGVKVRRSRLHGTSFEQLALPLAGRSQILVSLGGPAPLLARRQVVTMHDATPFRIPDTYSSTFGRWYRLMYRVLARRSLKILTVSEFSARELTEILAIPPSKLVVAPDGCDHVDRLEPSRPDLEIDDEVPFVLCVGTLARHKNLPAALTALERAGVRAVVVGARGSSRVFESADTQSWPNAVIAGRLSDAEIAWLYRHAVALVFPSLYEGFGLPIVEAQRLGCPVIASNRASIPEVAGKGAVYVDPERPEEIVEAVRMLREDPGRRDVLVRAGEANADTFLWNFSAAGIRSVIDELAGIWRPW